MKPAQFVEKIAEAEYLGWKVKICFTSNEDFCFVVPLVRVEKNNKKKINSRYIKSSEIKTIQFKLF